MTDKAIPTSLAGSRPTEKQLQPEPKSASPHGGDAAQRRMMEVYEHGLKIQAATLAAVRERSPK